MRSFAWCALVAYVCAIQCFCAAEAADCLPGVHHAPELQSFNDFLRLNSTRYATPVPSARGCTEVSFSGLPKASKHKAEAPVVLPIAVTSIAILYTMAEKDLNFGLFSTLTALLGLPYPNGFRNSDGDLLHSLTDTRTVLSANSTTTDKILSIAYESETWFAARTTFEQAQVMMRSNPRIEWVDSDMDVMARLQAASAGEKLFGFVPFPIATGLNHAVVVTLEGQPRFEIPRATYRVSNNYIVDVVDGSVSTLLFLDGSYPLVMSIVLYTYDLCTSDDATRVVKSVLDQDPTARAFPFSGTIPLSLHDQLKTLDVVFSCPHRKKIAASGSSLSQTVVERWSQVYTKSFDTFVHLDSHSSGQGIEDVLSRTVEIGVTDSVLDAHERSELPNLQFAPVFLAYMSVVVNIPGAQRFNMPVCFIEDVFDGTIEFWDDPALVASNPSVHLPHRRIAVVARSNRSGSTEAMMRGFEHLGRYCGHIPRRAVTGLWPLKVNKTADSTLTMARTVSSTPWSIGYMHSECAKELSVLEALLIRSDETLAPTTQHLQQTADNATIDTHTSYVTLHEASLYDYPFISMTYFVWNNNDAHQAMRNCTRIAQYVAFVNWVLTNTTARSTASMSNAAMVPSHFLDHIVSGLHGARCDGVILLPRTAGDDEGKPLILIAAISVLAVAVATLAFVLVILKLRSSPTACAPKGPTATLVVTSVQDSATLWNSCPISMAAAIEAHHAVVRRTIARHKAYEVKTVGDGFVIACKTGAMALRLAADIHENMRNCAFPKAIRAAYDVQQCTACVDDNPSDLELPSPDSLWNGLRVQIGVHTGPVEVRASTHQRRVDYYGLSVLVATQVQHHAVGGQVLLTSPVEEANHVFPSTYVGTLVVTGLVAPVRLFSLRTPLVEKRFPVSNPTSLDDGLRVPRGDGGVDCMEQLLSALDTRDRDQFIELLCHRWQVKKRSSDTLTLQRLSRRIIGSELQKYSSSSSLMGDDPIALYTGQ